jgi:hypothetical protein
MTKTENSKQYQEAEMFVNTKTVADVAGDILVYCVG